MASASSARAKRNWRRDIGATVAPIRASALALGIGVQLSLMMHRYATLLCLLAGAGTWSGGLRAQPSSAGTTPGNASGGVAVEPGSSVEATEPVATGAAVAEPLAASAVEEAAVAEPVAAEPAAESGSSRRALGVGVDLLPIVLSATAGEVGLSAQLWAGFDHFRFRLVGARIAVPNGIAADNGFEDQVIGAVAGIVDYTFGPHFDGWWVGAGLEYWNSTMSIAASPGSTASWEALMATFGGGYIFQWGSSVHFYLEPWAGLHLRMTPARLSFGGETYTPQRVQANASVKLGVFFDL